MKECFKCGCQKPLSEFYKHRQMVDGHLNKCKDCTRSDSELDRQKKMNDPEWVLMEQDRQRKKAKDQYYKYPEKSAANNAARSLGKCSGFNWHHWSYKKKHRLDCIRVSPELHRKIHRFLIYDPEQMMFRIASTGELLDSKNRHKRFINEIQF